MKEKDLFALKSVTAIYNKEFIKKQLKILWGNFYLSALLFFNSLVATLGLVFDVFHTFLSIKSKTNIELAFKKDVKRFSLYTLINNWNQCYQVLSSAIKCYQVLSSFTKCYQVLPSAIKFYQVLSSVVFCRKL